MQQRFDEWLEEKLLERGWQAADLARASRAPDYPRGFDPGLISRWRKPPPNGVVPSPTTLVRLAEVLRISRAEAFRAAGLLLPDSDDPALAKDDPALAAIRGTTAEMAEVLRGLPRVYWGTIIKAFTRGVDGARDMAQLLADAATGEAPLSTSDADELSKPDRRANGRDRRSQGPLADSQLGALALLGSR